MSETGLTPTTEAFNALLDVYAGRKNVKAMEKVFSRMAESGVAPNISSFNQVLEYYIETDDAERVDIWLEGMEQNQDIEFNTSTFNLILRLFVRRNDKERVTETISIMEQTGVRKDIHTFNLLIDFFCELKDISTAVQQLRSMKEEGILPDLHTQTLLRKMEIEAMLEGHPHNVADFNVLVHIASSHGTSSLLQVRFCLSLSLFLPFFSLSFSPVSFFLFLSLSLSLSLSIYLSPPHFPTALLSPFTIPHHHTTPQRLLQQLSMEPPLIYPEPDLLTYNSLVRGFARCLDGDTIRQVLTLMKKRKIQPSLDTYNLILEMYSDIGTKEDLFNVLEEMRENDIEPSVATLNLILSGLAGLHDKQSFDEILRKFDFSSSSSSSSSSPSSSPSSLLSSKSGGMEADSDTYEIIVDYLSSCEDWPQVLVWLERLVHDPLIIPSETCLLSLIDSFSRMGRPDLFKSLFNVSKSNNNFPFSNRVANRILQHYSEEKNPKMVAKWISRFDLEDRSDVVVGALADLQPNTTSLNLLLSAYASSNQTHALESVFQEFQTRELQPDVETFEIILGCTAKRGDKRMLDRWVHWMREYSIRPNIHVLNAMLRVYAESSDGERERGEKGEKVKEMWDTITNQKDVKPNAQSFEIYIEYLRKRHPSRVLDLWASFQQSSLSPSQPLLSSLISFHASTSASSMAFTETIRPLLKKVILSPALVGTLQDAYRRLGDGHKAASIKPGTTFE